jgi:cell division protein FtsQ
MIGVAEAPEQPIGANAGTRRWLTFVAVAIVLLVVVWLLGFSSVLGVGTVTVKGNHAVATTTIRETAAIRSGTPLLRLDKGAVQRRLAALPGVRSVTVTTSYPSTVTITVTERVAVAYRITGGGSELVDRDNVAFRTVTSTPAGLPLVDDSGDVSKGAAAATVAASLPAAVAKKVSTISVPSTESITLKLADGRTILWGGTDRSNEKARLLQALLGQPGTYFDLSDPGAVISRGAPTGN